MTTMIVSSLVDYNGVRKTTSTTKITIVKKKQRIFDIVDLNIVLVMMMKELISAFLMGFFCEY